MTDRPTRSHASQIETPQDRDDDVLQRYGHLSNTFDHARDPLISRQLNDEIRAGRVDDDRGPHSWMIAKDQPRQLARPSAEFTKPIDREFHQKLMAEDHERSRIAQVKNEAAWEDQIAEASNAEEQSVSEKYADIALTLQMQPEPARSQELDDGFER